MTTHYFIVEDSHPIFSDYQAYLLNLGRTNRLALDFFHDQAIESVLFWVDNQTIYFRPDGLDKQRFNDQLCQKSDLDGIRKAKTRSQLAIMWRLHLSKNEHKIIRQPRATNYLHHGFRASWQYLLGVDNKLYLVYSTDTTLDPVPGLTEIKASTYHLADEACEAAAKERPRPVS